MAENILSIYKKADLDLPTVKSTIGNSGIQISELLGKTDTVTYDPGFVNTAACISKITYIDGDAGILLYRGYPIEQLAEKSSFLEVSYLLIYGQLPTSSELEDFDNRIRRHTVLPEDLKNFFKIFPRDAHPMAILASSVSALSTFYQDSSDYFVSDHVERSIFRLLAKIPVIAAYTLQRSLGRPILYPDNSLNLVDNFLRLSFGIPAEDYVFNPKISRALDILFMLHADHEQNCSTSTVRLVGSAHGNLFSSISAGINALSGPLHGGANQAVMTMLRNIRDSGDSVETFVSKVKDKKDHTLLMGFGHRVYKNYDPRAKLVKNIAHEVLNTLGGNSDLLDIAIKLEDIALQDEYFIERKLYPNVDFYTGMIYKAMGFPESMFTVLFAIGRLPGWIAQWTELMSDSHKKIGRPRQIYVGDPRREYPK